jgi:FemAB family protein
MNRINILKILKNSFESSGYKIKFRSQSIIEWNSVLSKKKYFPIEYENFYLDYNIEYEKNTCNIYKDLSFIIFDNSNPIGLVPLIFKKKNNCNYITSTGDDIVNPIFIDNLRIKSVQKINKNIIENLIKFKNELNLKTLIFKIPFKNQILDDFSKKLIKLKNKKKISYEYILNLDKKLEEIFSCFDPNTRNLIRRSSEIWKNNFFFKNSVELKKNWPKFKKMHLRISGRKTRSDKSWKLQLDAIKNGNGLLILIEDNKNNLIGGGFFLLGKHDTFYSVGVFERELFNKPIGYNMQFEAIEYFINNNKKIYRVGKLFNINDLPKPSEKQMNISKFSKKFSSEIIMSVSYIIE